MYEDTLAGQVRQIMADTFSADELDLPADISQATYARWTSILHMVLLVALEEHFGVTFAMDEMTSMTSLATIVDVLQRKQAVGQPV
jgi:acyl carrier protein